MLKEHTGSKKRRIIPHNVEERIVPVNKRRTKRLLKNMMPEGCCFYKGS